MRLNSTLIASASHAPSFSVLITLANPGETFGGTYPLALTRQASIASGSVNVPAAQPPTPVNLETGAGVAIGDTSAVSLVADQVAETIVNGGAVSGSCAAIASFKAASGQTPARRLNAGAVVVGSSTSVSPTYGQATAAGNLAVCVVSCGNTSGTGQVPTTAAAGWVEAVHADPLAGDNIISIWYKPNIGANEVAPTFTASNSTAPMIAQLVEYTGCATSSPLENTGSIEQGGAGTVITVACGSADAAGQDLVVQGSRWIDSGASPTFTQTVTNGATLTHDGDATSGGRSHSANHAVNPAAAPVVPLGVRPWNFDGQGNNIPGIGTAAGVTLSANPTKKWVCTAYSGDMSNTAATSDAGEVLQLFDGAVAIASHRMGIQAAVGSTDHVSRTGLAKPGAAVNTLMQIKFGGSNAGTSSSVNLDAYLQ